MSWEVQKSIFQKITEETVRKLERKKTIKKLLAERRHFKELSFNDGIRRKENIDHIFSAGAVKFTSDF